jgi:hypothetical protein
MRNDGPEFFFGRVNEPETATVRADEIAGKVGVQANQFVDLLLAADAGRVLKDGTDSSLGLTVHYP